MVLRATFIQNLLSITSQKNLAEQGVSCLLAQLRGTGVHSRFLMDQEANPQAEMHEYFGSYYEKLEDAHIDITAHLKSAARKRVQRNRVDGSFFGDY